jgi:dTMP kinase
VKIHKFPGYFTALEGLDGSGSDEVGDLLKKRLKREGLPVIGVKEPSSGPVGLLIKKLLLQKNRSISSLVWEYLFAADREWLMGEKIIPALEKGCLVVSDRSFWSSIANRALDYPIHWLMEINNVFIIPNVTYFIDVSPQVCAGRIKKGEDELQIYTEEDRLEQIQDNYHWILNKYPYWFRVIDGEKDQKLIVEEITADLLRRAKVKRLKK